MAGEYRWLGALQKGFKRTEMAARKMQMAKSATERILGTQWLLANSATKMLLLLGT
jgi:hypothetical protein